MNTHFSTLKTQLRNCVVSIHNLQDIVQKVSDSSAYFLHESTLVVFFFLT